MTCKNSATLFLAIFLIFGFRVLAENDDSLIKKQLAGIVKNMYGDPVTAKADLLTLLRNNPKTDEQIGRAHV